jgi:hypothetical protein
MKMALIWGVRQWRTPAARWHNGNSYMADMRELPVVQSAAHALECFRQAIERFVDKLKIATRVATRYDNRRRRLPCLHPACLKQNLVDVCEHNLEDQIYKYIPCSGKS